MGHYAKVENGIVVQVNVIDEDYFEQNKETRYIGQWIKTSYNTIAGIHWDQEKQEPSADQSKALRKNFAAVGYSYDEVRDAFIPPKPYDSWILDEDKCIWMPPFPAPTNEPIWYWDDNKNDWEKIS